MKRFLLLILCLSLHSAQSMQRPLGSKAVGIRVPRVAGMVTAASLIHSIYTIIRLVQNRTMPAPQRRETAEIAIQTDPIFLPSEIQERLTEQIALLQELHTQQATRAADSLQQLAIPDITALQQAITELTTHLQQQATSADADSGIQTELETIRSHLEQLPTQHRAADVNETDVSAAVLAELQQQRAQIAAQTTELHGLRTNLEASQRCNRWITRGMGAAAILYAVVYCIASQIQPFYPT